MAQKYDHRGYPCRPRDLSENFWFYVQKEGLMLYGRSKGGHAAEPAILPWRAIKQALRDHEKAKSRRRPKTHQ